MRRPSASTWLAGAVFAGALLSRSLAIGDTFFHPDASTVLWMALDAVRDPHLPDHGLISSTHVFQPPGMVWTTMPWVALGGGRPEVVMLGFALLNAASAALLVATVGRRFGLAYAAVLGAFLVVGPDAFFSPWVWHPSLYPAAMALLLAAGIRLRDGSAWWAAPLAALPGVYALVHYSGLFLSGPALALLVLSRRRWGSLVPPLAIGATVVACSWAPFLAFESERSWRDLDTAAGASDVPGSFATKVTARIDDAALAISHLARIPHSGQPALDIARVMFALWPLVALAVVVAVLRRRWRDPGFALPAVVLVSGFAAQIALAQGDRSDVVLLWLVPSYALAAWAVAQIVELARARARVRGAAVAVAASAVALVTAIGILDLRDDVDAMPVEHRLSAKWEVARSNEPVDYPAAAAPDTSSNRFYLPCDPPYDWGSEVWYLREVLERGRGLEAALAAGAFDARAGPRCVRGSLQER